jgi:hypothetical protein
MVDADEYYGNFLRGDDLKEDLSVTIKAVDIENIEEKDKIVVSFEELKKSLVLNVTNKDRLKKQFGTPETDKWIGKRVTLTTEITYNPQLKKDAPAVRIKQAEEPTGAA